MDIRNWRKLERHPLSAQYQDIKGKAWEKFVANLREFGIVDGRKVVVHEGKVIDAWQLYRACLEADVKPDFVELRLPKGMDAEQWVEVKNDIRRHETQEAAMARIEARRERVAAARADGQSIRTIAEEEEVSEKTIRNDLEESTAEGYAVDPENGKITGKDGRTRPARMPAKPKILCARCQRCERVGQPVPKNCEMCRELRGKTERKQKEKPDDSAILPFDAFGTPLPKNCRSAYQDPWIQSAIDFIATIEEQLRKERLADGMNKRKSAYPFFNVKDFIDGVGFALNYLDQIREHLKTNRPAGVCPACNGAGCSHCKMSGMVPRELYKKLKSQGA